MTSMATDRPFRFGASIWGAATRKEWRKKSKLAESAGFDTLLTADHLVDGMLAPLTSLIVAAEATSRIRVGTLVLNNDFRHPVVLAREAATVDLLTDGRLELGLGAGHMKFEYDGAGLSYDPPGTRVARLGEAAEIIRLLWEGRTLDFSGDHYKLDGVRCFPVPSQKPLPLLIGGNGRRVLSTAARCADIVSFTGFSQVEGTRDVNPNHFTRDGLETQIGWVRAAAGDRFNHLELSTLVQGVTLTDDRRLTAQALQPLLPSLSVDDLLTSPYGLIGTADEIADQLRQQRDQLGVSYITVFEKDLDAMSSVIDLLKE
jgi:probable F420-dependent oxidoreductase